MTDNNDIPDLKKNDTWRGGSSIDEVGDECVQRLAHLLHLMKQPFGAAGNLQILNEINSLIKETKEISEHGDGLSSRLVDYVWKNGGLDFFLTSWESDNWFPILKIIEQCITNETLNYVVRNALDSAATMAIRCIETIDTLHCKRLCTKLLKDFLEHSDETCNTVVKLGGLRAILIGCRTTDEETLGNCAQAFANMALFGGEAILNCMLEDRGFMWLFPLAFHQDLFIKYHACIAVARFRMYNKAGEILFKSGVLAVLEEIITTLDPGQLANSYKVLPQCHKTAWLQRFVPVLSSTEEDSRNFASFHFCLEASVLEEQGMLRVIREIGAVERLEKIARSQSDIGSYYASQVLVMIGENIQDVPV